MERMTVKNIKELLKEYDDDDIVVLSEDSEGNGFSPLADISVAVYVNEYGTNGDTYIRRLTQGLIDAGFAEEDLYHGPGGENCIVLWPER